MSLFNGMFSLSPGERALSLPGEGVPHPAATVGGDGETHHGFLPSPGAGQSHHLCFKRPRLTGPGPAQTKVAGQI